MSLAVSDITREVDRAFWLIGGVSVVLLVGITVAMIWLAVRFRRSRTRTTVQTKGNTALEIAWTVIPTIIVVWMFFVGYKGFLMMGRVPAGHMVVEVTGRQWAWSFHYPKEGIDSSEMVVPVDTPVLVTLTAPPADVVHSFYLPDFRVKEDALPGRETSLWFQADREDTYLVLCAEFCGKDHSDMTAWLKVVSREQYDAWVKEQQLRKYRPLELEAVLNPADPGFGPNELNINAQALYGTFCATCHGMAGDGLGLPDEARDFTVLTGWKRSAKVTDIYRTLSEGVAGTRMRAYPNLTPWERVALAHYVRAFVKEPLPADTAESYATLVAEYELDKVQAPGDTMPIERAMEILVREAQEGRATPGAKPDSATPGAFPAPMSDSDTP